MNAGRLLGIIVFAIGFAGCAYGVATIRIGEDSGRLILTMPSIALSGLAMAILGSGRATLRDLWERRLPVQAVFAGNPPWHSLVYLGCIVGGIAIMFLYVLRLAGEI